MNAIAAIDAIVFLTTGVLLGAGYFGLLYWSVRSHASQTSIGRTMFLYVLRLAMVAATFWVIVQHGAMQLLLALLGFLVARALARYWLRSA